MRLAIPKTIASIICGTFVYGLSIGMNFVIIPLMLEKYDISKSLIGVITASDIAAALVVAPLLPRLFSLFGVRSVLTLAILIRNTAVLCLPFIIDPIYWIAMMFIYGIGGGGLFTVMIFWANIIAKSERRGLTLGSLGSGLLLGIAVGPILLQMTTFQGYFPFLFSAMIGYSTLFPLSFAWKDAPKKMPRSTISLPQAMKRVPAPILGGMFTDYVFYSLSYFLVLYGLEHGLSKSDAAQLITLLLIGSILTEFLAGWLSDIVNRQKLLIISGISIIVCANLLDDAIHDMLMLIPLFILWCGSVGAIYNGSLSILGELFKNNELATANSAFSVMGSIGGSAGVLVTGFLMESFGAPGLRYSISAAAVVYTLSILYFSRKQPQRGTIDS